MEEMINSLKDLGLNRYEAQAYIGLTKIIKDMPKRLHRFLIYPVPEFMKF